MHSQLNSEIPRFAAEKGFIHKAVQEGDGDTSLQSVFPKVRGLGHLWDKEAGLSEVWGKMVGGKEKVK